MKLYVKNKHGEVHEVGTRHGDRLELMPEGYIIYMDEDGEGTMTGTYAFCNEAGLTPLPERRKIRIVEGGEYNIEFPKKGDRLPNIIPGID